MTDFIMQKYHPDEIIEIKSSVNLVDSKLTVIMIIIYKKYNKLYMVQLPLMGCYHIDEDFFLTEEGISPVEVEKKMVTKIDWIEKDVVK